jgi:spermidine synthase
MGKKIGKDNFWQRIGSYVSEITIERTTSPYNERLEVILRNGRYQLCTENAIYSYDDLYSNFRQAFTELDIASKDIQNGLLLGLGLGSIPYMLEEVFDCHFPMTAVEIDEEVVYLAEKYVLRHLNLPIQCICTDALSFLQVDQDQYDLICMDVFKDDIIPDAFRQKEFLELIRERLRPNGIFLFNHLSLTAKDKEVATGYFKEVFLPFFPNASYINTKSNYVLVNDRAFLIQA